MISYIVCKWKKERFEDKVLVGLKEQCAQFNAELIVVQHPTSIFRAYEKGRKSAKHEIIVYIHEDVVLLDKKISPKIVRAFNDNKKIGLLGVLGSAENELVPWWDNVTKMGHMIFPDNFPLSRILKRNNFFYMFAKRNGKLCQRNIGHSKNWLRVWETWPMHLKWSNTFPAGLIDGMFMAERKSDIAWDINTLSGWHCYDYDRAFQIKKAGFEVVISDFLLLHNLHKHDRDWLKSHKENLSLIRKKWGLKKQNFVQQLWYKLLFR
jgi:hypothetical protein